MDFIDKIPQIAVMLPPSIKVCRDMRQGVLRYIRTHGPWSLHLIDDRSDQQRLSASTGLYSGFIGEPVTDAETMMVASLRVPMVLIDPQVTGIMPAYKRVLARSSLIRCDSAEVGRCAARHFLGLGFRHFAYVGAPAGNIWSNERLKAFRAEVRDAGFRVEAFRIRRGREFTLSDELADLGPWLQSLPKPCAVFCAWDLRARQVVDACGMAGVKVPEEISILGVDDDEELCLSSTPPISSVRLDAERAGYEAARLLDDMLRGVRDRDVVDYGPIGIARRDTDAAVRGMDDPVVKAAAEFIGINATRSPSVADVARHVCVSVRVLERRFAQRTGMTVQNAIEHAKIERVKTLLAETNEQVKSIARACGFSTVSHLTVRFRRLEHMTMSEYRNRYGRLG
jgi:LacI family transcriptional regulator